WTPIVSQFDHNARDQLVSISYGNGITTTRSHDPVTFRIQRIQTSGSGSTGQVQDLTYTFDAAGNLTHIQDQAQQTVFFRNNAVDPSSDFTYDATYRLTQCIGREHLGQTNGQRNA